MPTTENAGPPAPPAPAPGRARQRVGDDRRARAEGPLRRLHARRPDRDPQPAARGFGHRLAPAVLQQPRGGRSLPARQRARSRRRERHAPAERAARGRGRVPRAPPRLSDPRRGLARRPTEGPVADRVAEGAAADARVRGAEGHARHASPGGPRAADEAAGLGRPDLPPDRGEGAAHGRGDQGGRLPGRRVRVEPKARRQPDHQAAGQEGIDRRRRLRQAALPHDHQHRGAADLRHARADAAADPVQLRHSRASRRTTSSRFARRWIGRRRSSASSPRSPTWRRSRRTRGRHR